MIIAVSVLIFKERISGWGWFGIALAVMGGLMAAFEGSVEKAMAFELSVGKIWILGAVFGYGIYMACVRLRPEGIGQYSFLWALLFWALLLLTALGVGTPWHVKALPLARTRCRGAFDLFGSGTDAGRAHFGEPSDQGGWGSHACPDDEFDAIRCCCTGRRRQSCHWPQRKPAVVPLGQSSADHPRHPAHSNEAIVSDSLRPAHLNSQTGRVLVLTAFN